VEELYSDEQRSGMVSRQITTTESAFLINDGKGNFILQALPYEAQFSPIRGIEVADFDNDGKVTKEDVRFLLTYLPLGFTSKFAANKANNFNGKFQTGGQ
jgi:hypothetical protein